MSIPIYLYDMGKLIFIFDSTTGQNDNAVNGTGLSPKVLRLCLTSGTAYLERFVFSRIPLNLEDREFVNELTSLKVKKLFKEHKIVVPVRRGRPKTTTPAFIVKRMSDGMIYTFENVRSARTYLVNTKVNKSTKTLY